MARPLRVNIEDGWYHAYARGLNRMCIYGDGARAGAPVQRATLREIGASIGGRDYAAVGMAVSRFDARLRRDRRPHQKVKQVTALLDVEMLPL